MIRKIIWAMFTLAMLIFSYTVLYQNLPREPIEMKATEIISETVTKINYGITPVFDKNLRFNHNNISYFIEASCSNVRKSAMIEAFQIFQEKMEVISFYKVSSKEADILVGCSENFIELEENIFVAGEGGPVEIINSTIFKIIQKGKIILYEDHYCEQPIVEIHELCHVFGFDHSLNPENIMYNTSNCNQKITQDMIEIIKQLYSIKPLPDARISELSAVKKGRYIDFNITVSNDGLTEIDEISLTLVADGKEIDTISLNYIGIGYMKTLSATNIRLPSMNIETIDFIIDYESKVEELNEENNIIQMTISNL